MDVRASARHRRFDVCPSRLKVVKRRREARQRLFEAGFSRRHFLSAALGAPALLMAAGHWSRAAAAGCGDPTPIPEVLVLGGGLPDIHVQLPGLGTGADTDPSTITDFNGHVGFAVIDGVGVHTDLTTNAQTTKPFEVDLRFMKGEFVTEGGQHCNAAFALI